MSDQNDPLPALLAIGLSATWRRDVPNVPGVLACGWTVEVATGRLICQWSVETWRPQPRLEK